MDPSSPPSFLKDTSAVIPTLGGIVSAYSYTFLRSVVCRLSSVTFMMPLSPS